MFNNDANDANDAIIRVESPIGWQPSKWHELCLEQGPEKEFLRLIDNVRARAALIDPKKEPRKQPRHLLIVGPEGTSKRTLAILLARCCYCRWYSAEGACGKCTHCRSQPYTLNDTRACPQYLFAHLLGAGLTIEGFEAFWRKTWKSMSQGLSKKSAKKRPAKGKRKKQNESAVKEETTLPEPPEPPILLPSLDLTRSKVILIEGFDKVRHVVQEHLHKHYLHPFGADHWIFTAEDESQIMDEVKLTLFWVSVHLAHAPLDLFIQFLGEKCRGAGIPYKPSELVILAKHCEQKGKMFQTAMYILDEASRREQGLAEILLPHDN